MAWTRADDEEHGALVARLLLAGASRNQVELACRQQLGLSRSRVSDIIARIQQRLAAHYDADKPHAKGAQAARLRERLGVLAGERQAAANRVEKARIDAEMTRLEVLLADIYGTRDPVQVSVAAQVSGAVAGVLGQMSEEQVGELLARARERRALAEVGRRALESGGEEGAAPARKPGE